MATNSYRIDVHHHILPPKYLTSLKSIGITTAGNVPFPKWDLDGTLEVMDQLGIQTAMTSISSPGIYFGDTEFSQELSRQCNEFSAELIKKHSQRFGAFAVLPLPNINASIEELKYSLDELNLDGVGLLSSINGYYLGDPDFNELYSELNKRNGVVCIHPNAPPEDKIPKKDARAAVLEFVFDTTRAVANLLYNSVLKNYPNIRFIVPHAGGTVPYLAWRITMGNRRAIEQLKNLYYDTALSATPYTLHALQELVPISQILFGSDYPFLPKQMIKSMIKGLEDYDGFNERDRKFIEKENALSLFPRLKNT